MSPAARRPSVVQDWVEALAGRQVRVLLADGDDARAVEAAEWLARHTSLRPVLLRQEATAGKSSPAEGVEQLTVARLAQEPAVLDALDRRPDGSERDPAESAALAQDPLSLAAALLASGGVDACVGGAARPTRDVIRAGLKVIGLAEGVSTVSSCVLLVLPDGRRIAYGDCAVLAVPDERQLADIALATAATYLETTGQEPVVAMLSFSTLGSAEHPEVDRVRAATALARARRPDLLIDGELQFDAAMLESVASTKAVGSPVAGRANVLIFPNLDAGNIGYKITERLAGAAAIGPILQGLDAPLNDLSRGCSSQDIAAVALVSALQAVAREERASRAGV